MATAKTRPWCCPHCRAQLGVVTYERGTPPALHLDHARCVVVRGGVVSFACPVCAGVAEWRVRRPMA